MTTFTQADDIEVSTRRPDGTLRPFVPIWGVTVVGAVYVRSYRGTAGAWYRDATHRDADGFAAGVIRMRGRQT